MSSLEWYPFQFLYPPSLFPILCLSEIVSYDPDFDRIPAGDVDKLMSTLKLFVRDWAAEGADEREACYEPLKQALAARLPPVRRLC